MNGICYTGINFLTLKNCRQALEILNFVTNEESLKV